MDEEKRMDAEQVLHGERFHNTLVAKGLVFATVFYLLLTVFALGTVGSIVEAVMHGQPLAALPALVLGALVIHFVREENLYGVVATLIAPYIVLGLVWVYTTATMLPTIFGTFTSPTLTTAVFTAIPVLLLGGVAAYLFNTVSITRRQLGAPALAGSILIALGAGAARLVQAAFQGRTQQEGATGGISGSTNLSSVLNPEALPNPEILFLTALLAFNLPFLYYGNHRFTLGRRDLAWYLLPVGLYLVIGVVGGAILL